jgi:hypothetical protein
MAAAGKHSPVTSIKQLEGLLSGSSTKFYRRDGDDFVRIRFPSKKSVKVEDDNVTVVSENFVRDPQYFSMDLQHEKGETAIEVTYFSKGPMYKADYTNAVLYYKKKHGSRRSGGGSRRGTRRSSRRSSRR